MKKLILAAMMCLAGAVFAGKVDLSQYKWAVVGDSISDPGHPSPADAVTKYYHYIARDTGIQVVYTNAVGGTGYKKPNGAKECFYKRLQDNPIPSDVDVVTVFGSINDWSLVTGGAVGSPTDDIKTSDTLSAHMNAVIDLVKAQAPKAKLVLVSGIYYGNINDTFQSHPRDALKAVAEARGIEFHDWLTEDKTDPLDFHHIAENPWEDGSFASRYTIDWGNTVANHSATFGHPNDLYNETWLAPKFTDVLVQALTGVQPRPTISLSQYKWAVVGDSLSDPDWLCDCGCNVGKYDHYYHFVARDTGIQVVYTNAVGSTGYIKTKWSDHDNFYNRLLERPIPSDVDVVTIMGSVNDNTFAPWDYSVGSVTDSLDTTNTPAAYINKTIDVVRQQAPNAKIVLVSGLYYHETAQEKYRRCMNIIRDIAAYRGLTFVDWLTKDESDPLDFSHITDVIPVTTECFATRYTADWQKAKSDRYKAFGHPNALYHETWLAPKFTDVLIQALTGVEPQPADSLSQYKWAVIGDEFSDQKSDPKPKYVDLVAQQTGIQVVYTDASSSGYWKNCQSDNAFYQRILAKPVPADADVITIFGTMNDVSYESEEYQGRAKVVPGDPGDSLPTLSYAAYVNAAIDALIRQAPKAKIILVGPLYRKGPQEYLQKNYVSDMLAKVAEYRGLEFHNWYDGMAGNPLDFFQIKTNDTFAAKYVSNYKAGGWYHIPSAAYHEEFIAPEIKSYLENALVGSGVPSVAPELGSLQVIPWGTSAAFYTTITRLGTGATAGDVYVAYGTSEDGLGEPVKIFDGATGKIDAELKDLSKNTKYYYSLTFRNNAATPLTTTAITGSFTTTDEVRPDWSDKKWALIGDSISDPTTSFTGKDGKKITVKGYYNYVARDTGIQISYVSCIGSTGYAHDKDADPTGCPCFYKRLLREEWRIPSDIDVVTIFGSCNDCNWYNRIGAATDTFAGGKDSYSAYVNGTIELVRQQAPNAKIILVSGIWGYGYDQSKLMAVTDAVRAIAELQDLPFYDWATDNRDTNPFDPHHMGEFDQKLGPQEGDFAVKYIIDWELWNTAGRFGHPNSLYHEIYYSPLFRQMLTTAFAENPTITLDEPQARPSTNYNGSAVSVSFTGEIPDGATVSAKVTLGGVDYVGTITDSTASFTLPADVVTAGNTYDGTITLTVGDKNYTKDVTLAQGTFKVDEDADWICESAAALDATGTWTGDKVAATDGKIEVSNAVFTAAKPSVAGAVVTIDSTFDFVGPNEDPFADSDLAGVKVVKVGKVNRYAFLTGSGVVTNLDATANVKGAVSVKTVIDFGANTIAYTVGDAEFGPYSGFASASSVSGVRYAGGTKVASLDGAYRYEGLDTNLAMAGGVEYATVAEAVAAGKGGVELLWDTTWEPSAAGDFNFTKNGFTLAIGGPLAYSVKDNGDGTVTVTVTGGETPDAPSAASITFVGDTVKVGVADAQANCWYALEKTTDLTKDFAVDAATWTKGSDLLAGSGELSIALGADAQAFYRVVVSATAP